ncbi:MAG: peptide ABC transporter substrate-binding protein, partial [Lachnospiraceae bacterium]|nr:peptide ABC transporter substrate-binding protein [Lachnospiraceae bacterium]
RGSDARAARLDRSGVCGGMAMAEEDSESIYRVLYSSELTTLNYLITASTAEFAIGANVVDTLIEYDSFGELQPSLATEWVQDEEANTWTFTIREGQSWVDTNGEVVADVTAQDFVDAMKYVLTPEYGSSTAQNLFGVITNAEEYYNGLAGTEGYEEIDFSEVGVTAVDDYTLVYTLAKEVPYFLSMLTYVCFMPAYGPQLEELGASFGTSAENMYYNGAFYLSSYEPQVELVMTKNPYNWDADNVYLDAIQKTYNAEAETIGAEMAKRGEIDYTSLSADIVDAWMADAETSSMVSMERPSIDYSYFYCLNFNMYALNEDYTTEGMEGYSVDEAYEPENWLLAVNNENFRQSIRHAINRLSTYSVETGSYADPSTYMQNTITPVGFATNSETGADYTEETALADIMATDSYDAELALSYKEAAIEELTAAGATFPVKILVKYNPSTTNWEDECIVLEQQLESVLGTDYIDITVEAGPSDGFLSAVRRSGNYMLMLCNWGADYADPETWTDPFYQSVNDDGSYGPGSKYSYMANAITGGTASADTVAEYFSLVDAARAITSDTSARYAAFAEAEAYLIDHALVIPYGLSVSSFVVSKLNPWEGQYAAFGVSNQRYKGMQLYDEFISMEQYEASAAEH